MRRQGRDRMTSKSAGTRPPGTRGTPKAEVSRAAAYDAAWTADLPAQGPTVDGAAVGPPGGTRGRGQGGPQARPPGEPCRLRAGAGARPDRHPGGAGGGPAPRARAAAPRADGRVALRLLPGHARRPGLRPRLHAADRHHRPGERRCPPVQLRPLRQPRADPRLRRQRLRRDAARTLGVGRQAPRREHRHRRARQRLHCRPEPGGRDGHRPWLPPVDGPLCRHAPA